NMHRGLLERPEDFLSYAVGDVRALPELHGRFVEHFRSLQKDCLGMAEEDCWTAADIPMTGGALIAKTLERWVYPGGREKDVFKFCVRKLGVLDPDHRQYAFNRWAYQTAVRQCRTLADLRTAVARNAKAGSLRRPKKGEAEGDEKKH